MFAVTSVHTSQVSTIPALYTGKPRINIVWIGLLLVFLSISCEALAPLSFIQLSTRSTNTRLFDQQQQQQITDEDEVSPPFPPQETIKELLLSLADETKRGFVATSDQRSQISDIITKLSEYNPTTEPANAYYDRTSKKYDGSTPTLAGKWTLVYTDAPDITSLDASMGVTSLLPQNAKLGRIGQECIPEESSIKNVIEWKRPDWVQGVLKQVGTSNGDDGDESRVLQKVCCEAKSSPIRPTIVELKLSGFELVGNVDGGNSYSSNGILSSLQEYALHGPAAWFEKNPLNLSGPLKTPFGQFELLYLDQTMRIIRTGQGFFAVNVRQDEGGEWF